MASLNEVRLMGNVCADLELRRTRDGVACSNFRLAVNETYTTSTGEKKERVLYVTVDVWSKLAEVCCEHIGRGSPVLVGGSLRCEEWTDTQHGDKRRILKVRADYVKFLGRRPDDAQLPEDPEATKAPAADEQNIPL